ncbi:MAG TPA: hypothetical protein VGI39_25345 [Polyangiaceae bacterium]|jgi:hypothetical protein
MRRLLSLILCAGALATGCSRSDERAPTASNRAAEPRTEDGGPAVDVETMAFLSEARALHHEANVKEEADDVRGAIAIVRRIVEARRPHRGSRVPEIEEVLADAWARIGELELRAGDPERAASAAREGLGHAEAPTYFRGHLLEVQGIAEETRASLLADAGNKPGAAKARAAAMALLEEAVTVQDRVIGEALDAGPGEGGRP